ncbi:MAG: 3-carboxy-cis,cis-muconate cycloisomerase, partial [Pseudomonadota bacterium]
RDAAHDLVQRASRTALARGRPLAEMLTKDPAVTAHLDAKAIARLTDPTRYLGEAKAVVDRVLAAWRGAASAK